MTSFDKKLSETKYNTQFHKFFLLPFPNFISCHCDKLFKRESFSRWYS